jgi:hypothetical protein
MESLLCIGGNQRDQPVRAGIEMVFTRGLDLSLDGYHSA